ncbi:hypothetical protein C2845_PM04G32870 [Panicum miliaceum]|uniref:XIAP-associated factor 1-like n=1 Tax=Panicum miliaceum TaxID=4540 RepID=A0A3L6QW86_PANMI|nr:hypothetical protein C2845_PM04G32870 [Panicum miliaceum]
MAVKDWQWKKLSGSHHPRDIPMRTKPPGPRVGGPSASSRQGGKETEGGKTLTTRARFTVSAGRPLAVEWSWKDRRRRRRRRAVSEAALRVDVVAWEWDGMGWLRAHAHWPCGGGLGSESKLRPLRPVNLDLGGARSVCTSYQAMAAADSDPAITSSTCAHCQREISSSNIALHSVHCARNLQKCEHCGDMVPRKLMDEHYDESHAPNVSYGIFIQAYNARKGCSHANIVSLPAVDLLEHQDVCGNPTEYCQSCRKYIRLREWIGHELQFHTSSNTATELSSDGAPAAAEQPVPKPMRPAAHGSQRKHLLLTIAIAGFAVLIGSILYQRTVVLGRDSRLMYLDV